VFGRADKTRSQSCIPLIHSMQQVPPPSNLQPLRTHREGELFGHWIVLLLCTGILLGGLLLFPPSADLPYLSLLGIPIPDTCSFKNLTRLPCPGCGLTRSIAAGMHGDFRSSLTYHRLGLLTLLYVFLQFLFRLIVIALPSLRTRVMGIGRVLNRGMIVLVFLYILNWGYTLLTLS
jgi:hypothetical protein